MGRRFHYLRRHSLFKQARIDPEARTLVWPNDVDLDPDVLYSDATGTPIEVGEKV